VCIPSVLSDSNLNLTAICPVFRAVAIDKRGQGNLCILADSRLEFASENGRD